jgi:two-component system alkaline phosphatase synthesis response regulator PhoP
MTRHGWEYVREMLRARVLVVDDDPSFLRAVTLALQGEFAVETVGTVNEAIARLSGTDVVVCDYRMQSGDGIELLRHIREWNVAVNAVLVTAYGDKSVAMAALNLHAFAMLEKPVDYEVLIETVRRAALAGGPHRDEKRSCESPRIATGNYIELIEKTLTARVDGRDVALTDIEFRLLALFEETKGQRLSRDEIAKRVWRGCRAENNLDTHLGNLRKKVPQLKRALRAVRGKGFIYEPE